MKYPFVIFYRDDKFSDIDKFFIQHSATLECSIFIANSLENIKNLYNSNYHMLITYGEQPDLMSVISREMLVRHTHINVGDIQNIMLFNEYVNTFYVSLCAMDRENVRPIFSLFTPSFNSFHKILRVYNSLLKQTLIDWEWVIVDDSPDDKNFQFLREHFTKDTRIRFYRRSANNGSIGNVKNETIGLCRGKYVLEMDHDDELMPYVLEESANIFNESQEVGFIYYDCACVYENGNNQWYGDFICKGYGGYYSQKYEGKWRLVYITPNINNITMSHLVCCPNHPRIWRKDKLLEMGSYCEYLPICDDYEILLRTSINCGIVKVHKLGYIQYMNDSNNNFSLIRNGEINRIGPNYISPIYYQKFDINNKMKLLNAYEDEKYIHCHSKIWERDQDNWKHKYCNKIVNKDYDKQFCIIGFDSLIKNMDYIKCVYTNSRNDFLLLDNKGTTDYLQERLEFYGLDRVKCYSLPDTPDDRLINYFKLLYLSTEKYDIINDNIMKPLFNSPLNKRSQIINKLTNPKNKYLEIGVEYGETFLETHFISKIGVDPDPKFNENIWKMTSDDFFKINENNFDAIFIDGMHQVEYILNDINNSINVLNDNGIIFVDDILPFNYNEQLKIPIRHRYENGILKYGENWTGDVWKIIYHILLKFKDKIKSFDYYYNSNFRGIATFKLNEKFQINNDDIEIINSYDYFDDYKKYVLLLSEK